MLLYVDLIVSLEHVISVKIVTALKSKLLRRFCLTADNSTSVGIKRSLSEGKEENDKEIKTERDGKRARLDGEELEAQLELKITANGGSRHKLEKVRYLSNFTCRLPQTTRLSLCINELGHLFILLPSDGTAVGRGTITGAAVDSV